MAKDRPRCQAVIGIKKSGTKMKCGRPIEYVEGGVFEGWVHEEPYGMHTAVPDSDWYVDHDNCIVAPVAQ
jgi:hypothetical protein